MSHIRKLTERKLVNPPKHVVDGLQYETIMGSIAYGVSGDASDMDVYGFSIPEKDMIFPHLKGEIPGFGRQIQRFQQWQEHHINDEENKKEYDFSIYSIVQYFQLCMECNPNMIDSLYTPQNCILYISPIAQMVRDNRDIFLSKLAWHKFKGYAYSQIHKMKNKSHEGKRVETVKKYGYDIKFAYHVVRLLDECEQILTTGTINLRRDAERLKSIRRGEWAMDDILSHFEDKERYLEKVYEESALPHSPREDEIKELLMECLRKHFGKLDDAVVDTDKASRAIEKIRKVLDGVE
jgi:predicted nucleotidyltransferase